MTAELSTIADVRDHLAGATFAMVTSIDERGTLSSRPVTLQEIDSNGDLWFLVDRNSEWVSPLDNGPVNASVAKDSAWLSFAGRASLVEDNSRIEALKDPMSESFFDEGSNIVALQVVTDRIEWWAAPNKAVQAIELAKAKLTGDQPDLGDSGTIEV